MAGFSAETNMYIEGVAKPLVPHSFIYAIFLITNTFIHTFIHIPSILPDTNCSQVHGTV